MSCCIASETWAVKETDLLRLEDNDMRMIRSMFNVTLKDRKPSSELRLHLGLDSIRNCIRRGRLRWFGHVERCSDDSMVKKCRDIVFEGQQRKGRNSFPKSKNTTHQLLTLQIVSRNNARCK